MTPTIENVEECMHALRVEMSQMRGAPRTKHDVVQEMSNWGTPHAEDAWDHAVREGIIVKTGEEDLFGPKYKLASKFSTDGGRADHRAIKLHGPAKARP